MRKIITTTFVTLDGVMQAPGGPEEDTSREFKYGGWTANYWDEIGGSVMSGFMKMPFDLLLGRKTYDIFASYWPDAKEDGEIKEKFNAAKKYVVSHEAKELAWNNSELITGDVAERIRELKKQDGPDLWVHGSGNLIQTLLKENLIDRMHVWIFPVVVGGGKRLFENGVPAQGLKLVDSKTASTGVVIATYEPAGELVTGTIGE
ncbi:MAG: dihydrofolate reductase family protein [Candidatus Moranbacteria bacterium]|nr:dihydrofolate reductase family protein [Candidatus Moranbacteria bacterium]